MPFSAKTTLDGFWTTYPPSLLLATPGWGLGRIPGLLARWRALLVDRSVAGVLAEIRHVLRLVGQCLASGRVAVRQTGFRRGLAAVGQTEGDDVLGHALAQLLLAADDVPH